MTNIGNDTWFNETKWSWYHAGSVLTKLFQILWDIAAFDVHVLDLRSSKVGWVQEQKTKHFCYNQHFVATIQTESGRGTQRLEFWIDVPKDEQIRQRNARLGPVWDRIYQRDKRRRGRKPSEENATPTQLTEG
jgi:hypothetical protein